MTYDPVEDLPDEVHKILARQDGLVTRAQLTLHQVPRARTRWRSGRHWTAILPNVFLVDRAPATERQRCIAALLWAGPRAYLTGPSAARLHGLSVAEPARVLMLTPEPCRSREHGFATVRRTTVADHAVVERGPLRYASAARAAIDTAAVRPFADARSALLIEAVQKGTTDVAELHEWLCRLRTRDAKQLLVPLQHAASGAWSLPEAELLNLVATSEILPLPMANPALTTADGRALLTPDVWFDDVGLAVMVHSHLHHSQGQDWVETVERDGDLTRVGVVVAGVTPTGLRQDPSGTLRRLEDTYVAAQGRSRPDVVAIPKLS